MRKVAQHRSRLAYSTQSGSHLPANVRGESIRKLVRDAMTHFPRLLPCLEFRVLRTDIPVLFL
jgi:hypothetical protein